jgi:hypothetical protein
MGADFVLTTFTVGKTLDTPGCVVLSGEAFLSIRTAGGVCLAWCTEAIFTSAAAVIPRITLRIGRTLKRASIIAGDATIPFFAMLIAFTIHTVVVTIVCTANLTLAAVVIVAARPTGRSGAVAAVFVDNTGCSVGAARIVAPVLTDVVDTRITFRTIVETIGVLCTFVIAFKRVRITPRLVRTIPVQAATTLCTKTGNADHFGFCSALSIVLGAPVAESTPVIGQGAVIAGRIALIIIADRRAALFLIAEIHTAFTFPTLCCICARAEHAVGRSVYCHTKGEPRVLRTLSVGVAGTTADVFVGGLTISHIIPDVISTISGTFAWAGHADRLRIAFLCAFEPLLGKQNGCTNPVVVVDVGALAFDITTKVHYIAGGNVVPVNFRNDAKAAAVEVGRIVQAALHGVVTVRIASAHFAHKRTVVIVVTIAGVVIAVAAAKFCTVVFSAVFVVVAVGIFLDATYHAVRAIVFPTFASAIKIACIVIITIRTIGFIRATKSIVVAFFIGRIAGTCKGIGKIAALATGTKIAIVHIGTD